MLAVSPQLKFVVLVVVLALASVVLGSEPWGPV
jgi:hypothetical protein